MQQVDYLTLLLGFQGFEVSSIETRKEGDIDIVVVDLKRQKNGYICSGCDTEVFSKHSSWRQEVRHLHFWRHLTILRFQKVKVRCPRCGVKVEKLRFLDNIKIIYDKFHVIRHLFNALNYEAKDHSRMFLYRCL